MGIQGLHFKKEDVIQAVRTGRGCVTHAAKALGCMRDTISNWRNKDPDVAQAFKEELEKRDAHREEWIDKIKDDMYILLYKKMRDGDTTAIIYALKSFGGHGDGGGTVINIVRKDPTLGEN